VGHDTELRYTGTVATSLKELAQLLKNPNSFPSKFFFLNSEFLIPKGNISDHKWRRITNLAFPAENCPNFYCNHNRLWFPAVFPTVLQIVDHLMKLPKGIFIWVMDVSDAYRTILTNPASWGSQGFMVSAKQVGKYFSKAGLLSTND
jgi:hypothetical protein